MTLGGSRRRRQTYEPGLLRSVRAVYAHARCTAFRPVAKLLNGRFKQSASGHNDASNGDRSTHCTLKNAQRIARDTVHHAC